MQNLQYSFLYIYIYIICSSLYYLRQVICKDAHKRAFKSRCTNNSNHSGSCFNISRNIVVVTGCPVRGSNYGRGKISLSPKRPFGLWGPPILRLSRFRGSFLGVKRPGRGVDRSHPSNDMGKNEWMCTCTPPVCLHGVYRENCCTSV